jgi:hypothetical protein
MTLAKRYQLQPLELFRQRCSCIQNRVSIDYCCVFVDMVWYTVQQPIFLCESYVQCGSARQCLRKCLRKFPGNIDPGTRGILVLIKKARSIGPRLDKKPARNCRVLTEEELGEIGARLKHAPQKPLISSGSPCGRVSRKSGYG